MESLSSNGRFKNPLHLTISRSEIKPVYSWLLNVTAPLGEIPTKPFKVVWFLYALKSSQFNCKLLGIWHLTSVQLIMTLADLYLPLKDLGIVSITFLLGQMFICPNLKNIKLTHVISILLTVDADTLNNWGKWSSGNPCLSLHMTIKNSSRGLKDLALPFLVSSLLSL